MDTVSRWPKILEPLDSEQQAVYDDFMKRWHEILPDRYRLVERFSHGFPVRYSHAGFTTTIEVGAGLGEHLHHEQLSPEQARGYCAVELRESMAEQIRAKDPRITVLVGDCQQLLPFPDDHFDRYLAVHVLEHLPNLPACVREAWRLLDKQHGQFLAVIPCEGGLAYSLARRMSAQRIFESTYGIPYGPLIAREHLSQPHEILTELNRYFELERRLFFPLRFLPVTSANLCIGLVMRPRPEPVDA
jgi:SAM-dependent methyltransferase